MEDLIPSSANFTQIKTNVKSRTLKLLDPMQESFTL